MDASEQQQQTPAADVTIMHATEAAAAGAEPKVPQALQPLCQVPPATSSDQLFSADYWLAACLKNRYLNELQVMELCRRVCDILITESNVVDVTSPVTVVGDIHGQFYDLRHMFEVILN